MCYIFHQHLKKVKLLFCTSQRPSFIATMFCKLAFTRFSFNYTVVFLMAFTEVGFTFSVSILLLCNLPTILIDNHESCEFVCKSK